MAKTYVDNLAEAPAKALQRIGTNETIVQLLTNNPNVDMDSNEADDVFDKFLYDYGYVDETTVESCAYVCVEAEIPRVPTPTMQDVKLYVTTYCHKRFMQMDPELFPALIGNRRDNLVRYVDKVLDESDVFGIGKLKLESIRTVAAPAGFTAREITYSVSDFQNKGFL